MKNLFVFILFAIASSATLYGQITITKTIPQATEISVPAPYDSTKNFLGNINVYSYKGQLLYINGLPEYEREIGYMDFYETKDASLITGKAYKAMAGSVYSEYKELFGKYFYVRDVEIPTKSHMYNQWLFHLQNRDDPNDWCWYVYNEKYESSFPFITISYYNWLKSKIGSKIITSYKINDANEIELPLKKHDLYTGKQINFNPTDYWEIIDVTILDNNYELVFVLTNNNGITTTMNVRYNSSLNKIMLSDEYHNLVKKYGKSMVETVRQNKIQIGMPEELLIKSWGKPDRINKASYGNQWVYNEDDEYYDTIYVYIQNGKIIAWN